MFPHYGYSGTPLGLKADINRNGLVNFADFVEFAEQWQWEQ